MIRIIFPVQCTCLTVFLHNLSLRVIFGLPLGLETSTSYSILVFTQSLSSFHNIFPYHYNMFCCSTEIKSSIPRLFFNSFLLTLPFTLTSHIHLTIFYLCRLKCHLIFFPYRPSLTSIQHTMSHTTAVKSPSHYQQGSHR